MYKLLLLDIDGTLRDEYRGIPSSAKKAIAICRKKNCQVVICTGRSLNTIQRDVMDMEVDGYICGGGCHIVYHQKTVWDEALSQIYIPQILKLVNSTKAAFAMESKEQVYMNQGAKEIFDHMNHTKRIQKNVNKQFIQECITYEDNLATYANQPIHKLCLWASHDVFHRFQDILQEDMELAQQDEYEGIPYFEIIQKGYHKGAAVQYLQAYMGVCKEETICFGDGDNDIEMMKASGCGVAMKTSQKQVQAMATSICEDVWENGIYNELKRREII